MLLMAWLVVVAVAVLSSALALLTDDDGIAITVGIIGFLSFGTAAFGAFDLRVVRDGVVYQYQEVEIAMLMLTLSLIPAFVALTGPVAIIRRVREPEAREV